MIIEGGSQIQSQSHEQPVKRAGHLLHRVKTSENLDPLSTPEKQRKHRFSVFFTHHGADRPDTGSPENLSKASKLAKEMGADFVRFDVRMGIVNPKPGKFNQEAMDRYLLFSESNQREGLQPPELLLSSFPGWMKELYQRGDNKALLKAWQDYNGFIVDNLKNIPGRKVKDVQVLNESNHFAFDQVTPEILGQFCGITRQVFQDYNPDIKIRISLAAVSTLEFASRHGKGTSVMDFLNKLEPYKDSFDAVDFDPYQGSWDKPLSTRLKYRKRFDTSLLESAIKKVVGWQKEIGIAEAGYPAIGRGRRQLYFWRTASVEFKRMIGRLAGEGYHVPDDTHFGLYGLSHELYNYMPQERWWGITGKDFEPKKVAQEGFVFEDKIKIRKIKRQLRSIIGKNKGSIEKFKSALQTPQPPRLRKITDYLKRPF